MSDEARLTSDAPDEDGRLLARYAGGDAEAFEELVARHGRTVYAFVRRFLGQDGAGRADDVYQEVWLRVIRNADRFGGRSRFSTWLFQVTRNACIDQLREARRRRERVPLEEGAVAESVLDRTPGASETAEKSELKRAVESAVASLPDEQREVFLLRETTSLSFGEIARAIGASPNTVKSRMRYALEHVRRRLGSLVPARADGAKGGA